MPPPYPHYAFPSLTSNPQPSSSGWPTPSQMQPSSSTGGYPPNLAPRWANAPYGYPSYVEWGAQQPRDLLQRASYGNNVASSSTEGQALYFQHQQHMQQQQQPPPHSAPYPQTSPLSSYSFPPSALPTYHPRPEPQPAHSLPPVRPDAWSPTFPSALSSPQIPQGGPSSSTFAPSPTPTPAFPLPSTRHVAEEGVQPPADETVGNSAGLVEGKEVGGPEREEDVGETDPEEGAQHGEQFVGEQEKVSGEQGVEVDELDESSSEDEPLAATTANAGRFSVNAAKERPAFDVQVAPVYNPKTYSWVVKTASPYLKKLVNARESLFKAQRKLYNARLEDSSYEAVAAKVSTYARSKNSRFSNIALAVRRYICFCYTVDIPPWPLTPPLAALALSAVGTTKKTVGSRKQEVKQLRAITRAVAPLWSDMPGVQQLQSYIGAETALKEWVNAGSPSKTRDAVQSQAHPNVPSPRDEALTGKGKEKALETDDPPTPPPDSDEELESPEELVKRWAAEKAQRAKKPSPSSSSTQAAERTPSLPPQAKTPPLSRDSKMASKPVLDFDFTHETDSEAEEEEVEETPKASFSKRQSVDLEQPSPPRKRMLFREDSSFGLEETDNKNRSSLTPTPASPSPRFASPSPQPAHFSPAPRLPLVVFDEVDDELSPAPLGGNEAPPVHVELDIPSPLPFNPPVQFSLLDFLTTLAPPQYRLRNYFLHLFVGIGVKTIEALAAQKEDQENMLLDLRREAQVQGTDASERDWWALELKLSEWYATLPPVKKEDEEE